MVDLGKKDGRDSIFFIGIKSSEKRIEECRIKFKSWGLSKKVR